MTVDLVSRSLPPPPFAPPMKKKPGGEITSKPFLWFSLGRSSNWGAGWLPLWGRENIPIIYRPQGGERNQKRLRSTFSLCNFFWGVKSYSSFLPPSSTFLRSMVLSTTNKILWFGEGVCDMATTSPIMHCSAGQSGPSPLFVHLGGERVLCEWKCHQSTC